MDDEVQIFGQKAAALDLVIEQGATFQMGPGEYTDENDVLINLTGYTARMHIRRKTSDAAPLLDVSPYIVLGGALGTVTVTIPAAITAAQTWDEGVYNLEIESAGGIVYRLLQGRVRLSKDNTR